MKELDDLLERLKSLYTPIIVKGIEYPANDPYIMNMVNYLIQSGKLKIEDIKYDS